MTYLEYFLHHMPIDIGEAFLFEVKAQGRLKQKGIGDRIISTQSFMKYNRNRLFDMVGRISWANSTQGRDFWLNLRVRIMKGEFENKWYSKYVKND